jgi:hypothetical protein
MEKKFTLFYHYIYGYPYSVSPRTLKHPQQIDDHTNIAHIQLAGTRTAALNL